MKKVGLFLLALVMLAGLAGCGGGGDGDDGLPNECIVYCQNGCNRFVVCGILPPAVVNQCAAGCIDELEEEEIDDGGQCIAADSWLTTLSCDQLGDLIGLPSSAVDIGSRIGHFQSK